MAVKTLGEAFVPPMIRRYLDAYNRYDVPAMLACLSDDVRFENVSNSSGVTYANGKAALYELAT